MIWHTTSVTRHTRCAEGVVKDDPSLEEWHGRTKLTIKGHLQVRVDREACRIVSRPQTTVPFM